MPDPIIYIDTSRIREGKLDELEAAMERLARFIEANNPRVLSYRFFLDAEERRMRVVAVHPDSAALELHMDVGTEEFRKFGDLIDLMSIEVYGEITDGVLKRLDEKARMLGAGTVVVHRPTVGFAR